MIAASPHAPTSAVAQARARARSVDPVRTSGVVGAVRGLAIHAHNLPAAVGTLVRIRPSTRADREVAGQVVGLGKDHAVVMLLEDVSGIRVGDSVLATPNRDGAIVGPGLLGRTIDALGRPIDGKGPFRSCVRAALDPAPISPMRRARIRQPMRTGVRAIDLFTPLGQGQRIGLFAGPGVGKSTLLAQLARQAQADAIVIGLIGERGREVREFIEDALGPALARSVVVVATGDEAPLMRIRAAKQACAAAEHLRDRGQHVLLMIDSITRLAHAQRQVGLTAGEPPATRGYTPSVFALMGTILERAGSIEPDGARPIAGSITGIYTVLMDGDDAADPVPDAARGILDGHVMLSRSLAQRGQFPAVDVLDSISRLAPAVMDERHAQSRAWALQSIARARAAEDLVQVGAYVRGNDPATDAALDAAPHIESLLKQPIDQPAPFEQSIALLHSLAQPTEPRASASATQAKSKPTQARVAQSASKPAPAAQR